MVVEVDQVSAYHGAGAFFWLWRGGATKMKVDYDFLLKEITEEITQINGQIAAEQLAGNIVKEAAEKGEKTAFVKIHAWITRLKHVEAP